MQAERLYRQADGLAVAGFHRPVRHHLHRARGDPGRIVDHRARLATRHERPVGAVGAVGEPLAGHAQACLLRGLRQRRSGQRDHNQLPVKGRHGPHEGGGPCGIPRDDVVERAVGLHMDERDAVGTGEGRQRPDLIEREGFQFRRRQLQDTAAESLQVGVTGVGADGDPGLHRQRHRLRHHRRIAGVQPAGDVCRGDHRHERRILAQRVAAKTLAQIAIQVNEHGFWL